VTDQGSWKDDLGSRLERLADRLEAEYGKHCLVERTLTGGGGIRSVWVKPTNPDASPTGWFDFGGELQVYAGRGSGGRWELERTPANVDFIEQIVVSVVDGRASEVFGPSRSRVEVDLPDGSTAVETGATALVGCLPIPGWMRRGRRVRYQPYRT
jgi:hypothetical protein